MKIALVSFCFILLLGMSCLADDEPSIDDLKSKIESNAIYKDVISKGFTGKNEYLDLAMAEVLATKTSTKFFVGKVSEEQLDLVGLVLAYGAKSKSLPAELLAAFKKSRHLGFIKRRVTAWRERESGDDESNDGKRWFDADDACFQPNSGQFLVYPESFDVSLNNQKYAQVVHPDSLEKGHATYFFIPRPLIVGTKPQSVDDYQVYVGKTFKPAELGGAAVSPAEIQSAMSELKTKYIQVAIAYSQVIQATALPGGKGMALNIWDRENPGHPMLVEIPFKEMLEHSKLQPKWHGPEKPGCTEDMILVTAEYKGTKRMPNKLGMIVEFPILSSVAVYDQWAFYKK